MNKILILVVTSMFAFFFGWFIIWQLDIIIPLVVKIFFIGIVIVGSIFVVGWQLLNNQLQPVGKSMMTEAQRFAQKWWKNQTQEDLTYQRGKASSRQFDEESKFFAIVLSRISDLKKVVIFVQAKNLREMDVVDWNDEPDDEEIKNPFKKFSHLLLFCLDFFKAFEYLVRSLEV